MNLNYRFVYNVFRLKNSVLIGVWHLMGRNQDFKLGGGALKKIAPIRGRRENFWGISCEKSRFYAKKNIFFSNFRGGVGAPGAPPPPGSAPASHRQGNDNKHISLDECNMVPNL